MLSVTFIFVAMLATPLVSAKPTSASNNPNSVSFVWHSENGIGLPPEEKTNPPWAEGSEVIVTHAQRDWELNPDGNNYVQIDDGPEIQIDAETGYEGNLYVQIVATSPTSGALNYRVYEKIMWGEDNVNYIDIMCLERASYDGLYFYASGIFVGQGMIDGQKVQAIGIREGFVDPSVGFVLECYGTIRGAGN